MAFSLPGLIGAAIALVIGLINYGVIVSVVEGRLRALDRSQTADERAAFERRITLMRRFILLTDIVVFPFVGYVFGKTVGG
jgi:predicted DNA-binding transcriptional regulator